MKTISAEQAARDFDDYSKLAHEGQRILITREGKPWVVLAPPALSVGVEGPAHGLAWPDFSARLSQFYPEPVAGLTATELLAQEKGTVNALTMFLR